MAIRVYTTPTIELDVPALIADKRIYVSFKFEDGELTFVVPDITVTESQGHTLIDVPLSQEQTPFSAASSLSAMAVPGHSGGHFDPLQSPQEPASGSQYQGSRYQQYQDFSVPAKTAPDKASLDAFRASEKRAQLLFVIEQYIGKPLSPSEVQSVYYISEDLHFSDALIDYLLQYCIDRGKKDFRYIEKVAVNWAEHGITTPKQAEQAVSPAGRKRGGGTAPSANPFNRFEQNKYDFDQLEKEILSN